MVTGRSASVISDCANSVLRHLMQKKITFDQIISIDNIRGAYFDLVKKFDTDIKSNRYRGVDGANINNINFISEEILKEIQREMREFKEIFPAYIAKIPKKDGKKRKISIYTLKDRIKAEAVYRIIEPHFDNYLSSFVFSYRSSHPSYYAARSAIRRYKRFYGKNFILVTDITDYADSIDHTVLLKKINLLNLDLNIKKIIKIFIETKINDGGKLLNRKCGVLTGTPLYGILSNFYMDDFDKWAGKYVAFYRRVGDDMIAMDKDENKIKEVHSRLMITVGKLKLRVNQNKESLIRDTTPFKFLGYSFRNGKISFDRSSKNRAIDKFKKGLGQNNRGSYTYKIKKLKRISNQKGINLNVELDMLLRQKMLVDDSKDVQSFSDSLIGSVASHIFGYNTPQKRYQASKILRDFKVRSLFDRFRSSKIYKKK